MCVSQSAFQSCASIPFRKTNISAFHAQTLACPACHARWKRPVIAKKPRNILLPVCTAAAHARVSVPDPQSGSASGFDLEPILSREVLENPLREGIKSIAIGKDGTKPIPTLLIDPIQQELLRICSLSKALLSIPHDDDDVGHIDMEKFNDCVLLRASFMGALFVKAELSADEMQILSLASNADTAVFARGAVREAHGKKVTAGEVLAYISVEKDVESRSPRVVALHTFAHRLLSDERFDVQTAYDLGALLYAADLYDAPAMAIKVFIAHVMRIRHESASEIAGLARAASATLCTSFREYAPVGFNTPFVLVAEPFDGVRTWDLLTPLVTHRLKQRFALRTVLVCGVSSGPKYGCTVRDLMKELVEEGSDSDGNNRVFATNAEQLFSDARQSIFGAVVQQNDCSKGLASWIRARRVVVKRPSIATVEKYVDVVPGGAAVFVGSAFHAAYVHKMAVAAEVLGFAAYVIVGKGMEGTLGLGVGPRRTANLLLGLRMQNGEYVREYLQFGPRDAGVQPMTKEPAKGSASASVNATRIQRFLQNNTSGDPLFDARANTTLAAFDLLFHRIKTHLIENAGYQF